jgi:D-threo-aldose 1-dehydrogenase
LGRELAALDVPPENVVISNKLAWKRVPMKGCEPTFEPGVWFGIEHDAVQRISYDGILECWEQGCELLGNRYKPQLVSVHDPDEYLAAATSPADRQRRFEDILEAYRALVELKERGEVAGVGVGAKDWRSIEEIDAAVKLDWVMMANSLTIYRHPPELLQFAASLASRNIGIINAAVFHAGFLVGGKYFDYRVVDPKNEADKPLFAWRERFQAICKKHGVAPMHACIQFGLTAPGVTAVALSTSHPDRIRNNVEMVVTPIGEEFWAALKTEGLVNK